EGAWVEVTELNPLPGELWMTSKSGSEAVEKREDGWYWTDGDRCVVQHHEPESRVGFTVEYVEKLKAEYAEGDWSKLSRELHAAEAALDSSVDRAAMFAKSVQVARVERDEAIARAETAERALEDAERDREPWDVLREAAKIFLD